MNLNVPRPRDQRLLERVGQRQDSSQWEYLAGGGPTKFGGAKAKWGGGDIGVGGEEKWKALRNWGKKMEDREF